MKRATEGVPSVVRVSAWGRHGRLPPADSEGTPMKLGKRGKTTAATSLVVTIAMTAMMMLYAGGSPASSASAQQSARAAGSFTRVAHSPQGFAKFKIVGETAKGKRVTGSFTPLAFSKRNGHLRTRGLVSGVIHQGNGKTRT